MCRLLTLALALLVPGTLVAQEKGKEPEPIKVVQLDRKDPVLYEKEVEPIFYKKCVTCHSGSVKEGRLDISSYEGLVKGGKRGTAIVPGKKDMSLVYKLSGRTMKPLMPPKGEEPLSPQELAVIGLWIDQGAKAPSGVRERPKIVVGLPPTNVHPARAVAVSPDKTVIAASRGNQIHIYEGELEVKKPDPKAKEVKPDPKAPVKPNPGEYQRTLFDPNLKLADGKPAKGSHLSLVEALTFSPDGKWLVSGSFQEIAIWDVKSGELKSKITGFAHEVVALAFSADGKLLATAGGSPTEEGEVKFFETTAWKQVGEIKNGHSDTVYGLSFSPDAKMIATCSADKFIKTWEVPTGKFVKSFEGHTHHVLDVGWAPDGKLLASAGADNTVKVWDFEKGEQARTIAAHGKQVTRLLFIGKKLEVVTCGGDAQVKIFNVTNGGAVRNFPASTDFVYAIGVSPDGNLVAAGGQEGVVQLYNGNNGQIIRALLPPDAQPRPEAKKEEKKK